MELSVSTTEIFLDLKNDKFYFLTNNPFSILELDVSKKEAKIIIEFKNYNYLFEKIILKVEMENNIYFVLVD